MAVLFEGSGVFPRTTQAMAEESVTRCVLLPGSPRSRGRRVSHATAWQCRPTAPCGGRGWASDARRRRRCTRGVGEPSEALACLRPSTRIVSRQAWPLSRACPGRPWPPMVRRAHSMAVPCPCGMQIAGSSSYPNHCHWRRERLGWNASGHHVTHPRRHQGAKQCIALRQTCSSWP